jgi:hypothetical protein
MTYIFAVFMACVAIWFIGPIITKTVITSIKKIREEYDRD